MLVLLVWALRLLLQVVFSLVSLQVLSVAAVAGVWYFVYFFHVVNSLSYRVIKDWLDWSRASSESGPPENESQVRRRAEIAGQELRYPIREME